MALLIIANNYLENWNHFALDSIKLLFEDYENALYCSCMLWMYYESSLLFYLKSLFYRSSLLFYYLQSYYFYLLGGWV